MLTQVHVLACPRKHEQHDVRLPRQRRCWPPRRECLRSLFQERLRTVGVTWTPTSCSASGSSRCGGFGPARGQRLRFSFAQAAGAQDPLLGEARLAAPLWSRSVAITPWMCGRGVSTGHLGSRVIGPAGEDVALRRLVARRPQSGAWLELRRIALVQEQPEGCLRPRRATPCMHAAVSIHLCSG